MSILLTLCAVALVTIGLRYIYLSGFENGWEEAWHDGFEAGKEINIKK